MLIKEEKSVTDSKIFIVHGHQHVEAVELLLKKLDLSYTILSEEANKGRTIIEKFETYSQATGFAILLFTADDYGYGKRQSPEEKKLRARQNVVFECGYFFAKLGRDRTVALYEDNVEMPSDLHGLAYINLDVRGVWKIQLTKELKNAGFPVDMNKL